MYRVKDPAMLDQVKPGDTVKFSMEKVGGQYMVTRLGVAK
ncbi:MAG: copper-binding protein [Betaproteobacteria bacterium]|nr:copper-binding protein [Betaproteobacteria bacterium]